MVVWATMPVAVGLVRQPGGATATRLLVALLVPDTFHVLSCTCVLYAPAGKDVTDMTKLQMVEALADDLSVEAQVLRLAGLHSQSSACAKLPTHASPRCPIANTVGPHFLAWMKHATGAGRGPAERDPQHGAHCSGP